ncbi:SPFH domain-containing protein [Ruminococcus flavefaciens]|nr:SPFH domain-containing protein [Ruminococcus flavefaciens]
MCNTTFDVAKASAMGDERKKGLVSVIQYEGDNNTFVWRHPIENFNLGSQLVVRESQEALFFRDGQALDLFGAGRHSLETQNLPLLQKLYSLPTNADTPFQCEVYFINKTVQMGVKWGTPDKVRFIDPLTGTPLEIGASGEMNLMVSDSRRLILKLVGTTSGVAWESEGDGFTKSLQKAFRPLISNAVKTNLSSVIKQNDIDILEIDEKLDLISDNLKEKIISVFEEYGLTIPQFYVTSIVLPENDPNFKRIRDLHTVTLQAKMIQAQANIKVIEAQTETLYRTEQEKSKAAIEASHREAELQRQLTETEIAKREAERRVIGAQAEAESQRLQGLTEAEIMRAKGYNQKDVLQAEVQKAYAEGIGNMTINGSAGSAMGDMLGMGIGLAAAGNIAPKIGEMFSGMQTNKTNTDDSHSTSQQAQTDSWICSCGNNATGMFCNNCGSKKPAPAETWDCSCGNRNIIGNFCNLCGAKKPDKPDTWDCVCGNKGIIGNFCNICGSKRPDKADTWDCSCGNKGIIGNFCNICGNKRGENTNEE